MSRLAVEPARDEDAVELAAAMREADRAELAAVGVDPEHGVRSSIAASRWALTARDDVGIVCVFGLAVYGTALAPVGAPWMLGTDRVRAHRRSLVRLGPAYIRAMVDEAPFLVNFVHAENRTAVRWLRRAGFSIHQPVPHGPYGAPFHPFEMTRRNVC